MYNEGNYIGNKSGLQIKYRRALSINQVFDPHPKSNKKIKGKPETQGYKSEIHKRGSYHLSPNTKTVGNTLAYVVPTFLKIKKGSI